MKVIFEDVDGYEQEKELPDKIRLSFKTPDCLYYAVQNLNLDDELPDETMQGVLEEYSEKLEKWLEFGELVAIEFDVKNMTATVVET